VYGAWIYGSAAAISFIKIGDSQELVSAILEIHPLAAVPYSGWTKEEAPGINPGP
jgi:hypothetical protein